MNVWYWVLAAALALIPAFFVYKKDRQHQVKLNWLPAILRWCAFFLILAIILVPPFVRTAYKEQAAKLLVLIDSSTSMQNALKYDNYNQAQIISVLKIIEIRKN